MSDDSFQSAKHWQLKSGQSMDEVQQNRERLLSDEDSTTQHKNRQSLTLSWQNLQVSLLNKRRIQNATQVQSNPDQTIQDVILHSQSGSVKPGRMLAIMGLFRCWKINLAFSAINAPGVCRQRAYEGMPRLQCRMIIFKRLQQLGDNLSTIIKIGGYYLKGVSGGERKRTAIGVELVNNPNIIMLDEPTSGLDSFTAYVIVQILRDLCKRLKKTIILTIHQPSSEIFASLDQLLLLRQGHLVYQGLASDIIEYMRQASVEHDPNTAFDLPTYCNPADYLMEELSREDTFFTNDIFEKHKKMLLQSEQNTKNDNSYNYLQYQFSTENQSSNNQFVSQQDSQPENDTKALTTTV